MGVSRRALLGYSGSAAAGTVLASGGSAQANANANAINDLATSRGWPPIQFYGHVRTALN